MSLSLLITPQPSILEYPNSDRMTPPKSRGSIMNQVQIRNFVHEDTNPIADILKGVEWASQYVEHQLSSIEKLHQNKDGEVLVATLADQVVGYAVVQHHRWNKLSYMIGLVVSINHHRLGVGKKLVELAEQSSQSRGNRGIYLDTPVDNINAINFYEAIDYKAGYLMPHFYEPDLDAITYQKFWKNS